MSPFKVVHLSGMNRAIFGTGINVLGSSLHEENPPFSEIVDSPLVKQISKDLLHLRVPAVVSTSYIHFLFDDWSCLRKDNSFVRTAPLSTQV